MIFKEFDGLDAYLWSGVKISRGCVQQNKHALNRIVGVFLNLTVLMGSTHPALNQWLDERALRGDEFVSQLSRRVQ